MAESLPTSFCAINQGSLIQFARNFLQPGDKDDHIDTQLKPEADCDQYQPEPGRIGARYPGNDVQTKMQSHRIGKTISRTIANAHSPDYRSPDIRTGRWEQED